MRTAEVRELRERLAISEQYLEDTAVTRNTLKKAHARIKDLKEQLKKKDGQDDEHERDVKELQWRIRNNYELPVGIFANKKVERDETLSVIKS